MKYSSLIGWGVAIYAVMYLVTSGLLLYGLLIGLIPTLLKLATLVFVTALAGRSLNVRVWQDVIPYSVLWALIVALLDAVFWVPLSGWTLYASPGVWIGYAIVMITPIIAVRFPKKKSAAAQTA